ncbi:hypothetical protein Glove_66g22 [Diversispora epigaea]|uniref:Uncharacterized protein n=1 Tax=Diversispora epigaea TaxID=1348612 RepID=A0A397JF04_9GLOM|nr:hypothetical protein Glove_66g22 [Diversispora epigaea]
MIGEYTCPFYHNSGKVCGKTCMRPEGYSYHWKAKIRTPCIECGKPTGSTSANLAINRNPIHDKTVLFFSIRPVIDYQYCKLTLRDKKGDKKGVISIPCWNTNEVSLDSNDENDSESDKKNNESSKDSDEETDDNKANFAGLSSKGLA